MYVGTTTSANKFLTFSQTSKWYLNISHPFGTSAALKKIIVDKITVSLLKYCLTKQNNVNFSNLFYEFKLVLLYHIKLINIHSGKCHQTLYVLKQNSK